MNGPPHKDRTGAQKMRNGSPTEKISGLQLLAIEIIREIPDPSVDFCIIA